MSDLRTEAKTLVRRWRAKAAHRHRLAKRLHKTGGLALEWFNLGRGDSFRESAAELAALLKEKKP